MSNDIWLVTLPHAGGSSTIYKGWGKGINCNILNVEYPGHWTRMDEPLVNTFENLEKDILEYIVKSLPNQSRLLLFGHSLGAIIAWEIAQKLTNYNFKMEGLLLSASQSPEDFPENNIIEADEEEDLLEFIGYQSSGNVARDELLKKFFLPIISMDLMVCRSYKFRNSYCDIPAYILYGKEDSFLDKSKVKKWDKFVRCISVKEYAGGHFYLDDEINKKGILNLINEYVYQLEGVKIQ